ncbi:two-component system sensor histidine kinase UhpB [Methylohalomonas lacus]|uniref:Oxygen sensor histidine kinase NreB n=1 Tax=Methylohalomonas lacus TaxID=398773 RepID=A0AAE3HKN1_9GAMM|nr:ATP-binding protein [Methylohalomonas lacus]MCS3902162.1 two-component system sensor histidine kinase UhpB [Methylohalomonas lacus]
MTVNYPYRQRLSLRLRSLLLIVAVMLLMLVAGSVVLLYVARGAVEEEMEAGVGLASLLVDGTLHAADPRGFLPVRDVLQGLQSLRHVDVMLDSQPVKLTHIEPPQDAPQWFYNLLRPEDSVPTYRLPIEVGRNTDYVTIRPNPGDEIDEIWKDFKLLVGIAAVATFLTCFLIYLAIWRGLKPLQALQDAFVRLERGYFETRIASSAPRELAKLQDGFNHMAEVLQSNIAERRRLAGRVVEMQENDWRGLAREIHDELSPQIFRLRADAAALSDMLATASQPAAQNMVRSIAESVEVLQTQMQSLYKRLRPQALDELGLKGALEDMVNRWRRLYPNVEWLLYMDKLPEPLPDMVNVTVYRFVQEGLTNAGRHSGASRIETSLQHVAEREMLLVTISDNGKGLAEATGGYGFGLSGMRERLSALGGVLEYDHITGGGLLLRAEIPLLTDQAPVQTEGVL